MKPVDCTIPWALIIILIALLLIVTAGQIAWGCKLPVYQQVAENTDMPWGWEKRTNAYQQYCMLAGAEHTLESLGLEFDRHWADYERYRIHRLPWIRARSKEGKREAGLTLDRINILRKEIKWMKSQLTNPAQRAAWKALTGRFGKLEVWQIEGYKKFLKTEPTKNLAWITCYSEFDPGCNRITASGREVSLRVAAMLDVPFATWILIDLPEGYELRQCFDRASRRNISRARSKGATAWVDRYLPYRSQKSWVRPIYLF